MRARHHYRSRVVDSMAPSKARNPRLARANFGVGGASAEMQ